MLSSQNVTEAFRKFPPSRPLSDFVCRNSFARHALLWFGNIQGFGSLVVYQGRLPWAVPHRLSIARVLGRGFGP